MSDHMHHRGAALVGATQQISRYPRACWVASLALSAVCIASVPEARATPASEVIDPATVLTTERPTADQCVEEVRMQRRIGLGIAGASIFGGTYLITAFVGTFGLPYLYIPFVGPVVQAAQTPSGDGPVYVAVLNGLVQAGGVAMMIAGFATKSRTLVYRDTQISFAPYASPGGAGLFAVGRF